MTTEDDNVQFEFSWNKPYFVKTDFKVGDEVIVQVPGKKEEYYGTITYISNMYRSLLTIQTQKLCVDGVCNPHEKEVRVTEMFPTIVRRLNG